MWLVMRHFAATDADAHGNNRLWWATNARGILVVLAVALTAYAITWILGHTAATIGLAGAWLIIVEQFVNGADQFVRVKPFAPAANLIAIAQGHGSVREPGLHDDGRRGPLVRLRHHDLPAGACPHAVGGDPRRAAGGRDVVVPSQGRHLSTLAR